MENTEIQSKQKDISASQNIWDKIESIKKLLDNHESLSHEDLSKIEILLSQIDTETRKIEGKSVSFFDDTIFNKLKQLFPNNSFFHEKMGQFIDSVNLLIDWEDAFEEIGNQIDKAQKSIDIAMFIWRDDKIGNMLAQKILNAANRWVKVVINKDRYWALCEHAEQNKQSFFHSKLSDGELLKSQFMDSAYKHKDESSSYAWDNQLPSPLFNSMLHHPNITLHIGDLQEKMRTDGNWKDLKEVWLLYDHSKYWIFDDQTLIAGSINVGDEYMGNWHDYMVRMDSPILVSKLRARLSGNDDFDSGASIEFWLNRVENWILQEKEIKPKTLELIQSAKQEVVIEMSYFWDKDISDAIITKANQWVAIKIILPKKANVQDDLNKSIMQKILDNTQGNVDIYFYPRMIHAKVVHIDGEKTFIWSANFNKSSTQKLWDTNILISDKDCRFTQDLRRQLEQDMRESELFVSKTGWKIQFNRTKAYMENLWGNF